MNKYIIDVPVALIFFNRPESLGPVFECLKKARPSKLFLIQDGVRANKPNDKEKVAACRAIVENIDWECEVIKDYSDQNLGCGRRIFTGLKSAFEVVDRLVIVEDDITFGDSFLPFCAEMLEKYKDDQRIHMISGMNHIGVYDLCPNSYFFSKSGGAIWGWATWRRNWEEIEWDLNPIDDEYIKAVFPYSFYDSKEGKAFQKKGENIRAMIKEGKAPTFWSFHNGYYCHLNNGLNIVPKYNLIANIGLTAESEHCAANLKQVPKAKRQIFFAKIHDIKFPLVHPKFVLDDQVYLKRQNDIMKPKGIRKFLRNLEKLWIKISVH